MKVALCVIGRLENQYAVEYVEWYKKIGFDKIFIYDNNHDGEEHFEDVLQKYVDDNFVEVIDFRNKETAQLIAYNDCYNKHGNEYDWIAFFDFDEFLYFVDDNIDIKGYLSTVKNFDCVHINWMIYDDNNLVKYEDKPLQKRFTRPMQYDKCVGYNFPENNHIKSIVKGNIKDFKWRYNPHTPNIGLKCCDNRGKECEDSAFNPYNFDVCYLKHYQTKTIEEYLINKIKRGYPDRNDGSFSKIDAINRFFKVNEATKEKDDYLYSLMNNKKLVILSMTTIPKRKDRLSDNISAILNQTYKFDKLVINIDDNLSDEDYKWYENFKNIDSRIEINKAEAKWRSCNKLLPTLKKYPNDIIITIDDDIYYPCDTIKELMEWHDKEPDCIITHEINPIYINEEKNYVGYHNAFDVMLMQKEWGKYFSNCCLFPPYIFNGTDLYDYDKMMKCTNGTHDELWFWVNSTINGVQCIGLNYVRSFSSEMLRQYEDGEYQLTTFNNSHEKIESYMKKINEMYGERLLKNIFSKKVEFKITKDNIYSFIYLWPIIREMYWYNTSIVTINLTKNWEYKLFNTIEKNEKPTI